MNWYKAMEPSGSAFWSYFDIADELFHGEIPLEELDQEWVSEARVFAQTHELEWPPHLPTAEEALNDMNRYDFDKRHANN